MAKFKAGDIITNEKNTLTVISVGVEEYTVMNNLGQTEEFSIKSIDWRYSLHTGGW